MNKKLRFFSLIQYSCLIQYHIKAQKCTQKSKLYFPTPTLSVYTYITVKNGSMIRELLGSQKDKCKQNASS